METIAERTISPTLADIRIIVRSTDLWSNQEMQGRLVGPQCRYATTIEVAYPIRPLPRDPERPTLISGQVLIPEPSLWEPQTPFLYRGGCVVYRGRTKDFEATISRGIRHVALGKQGLQLNGVPFRLNAVSCETLDEVRAREWRAADVNTLLVPVRPDTADVWEAADRIGFFVLGRLDDTEGCRELAWSRRFHASCLGWLLPVGSAGDAREYADLRAAGQLLGVAVDEPDSSRLAGVDFQLCDREFLRLGSSGLGQLADRFD
jgi:hypothetical protein